ncbi:MAG TPA: hypothetical protein VIH53_04570 [Gemmatimonadaceae bacterium]
MKPVPTACAAIMLAAFGASHLNAQQSCSGTTTCTTTHSVTVTVGGLISLALSSSATGLTTPSATNISGGATLQDPGPSLTISANQAWTVNIRSLTPTNWNYAGSAGGVKPIRELAYSTSAGGVYTPITNTDALFISGDAAASGLVQASFFRTTWVPGFGAPSNAPGVYSQQIAFTITSP